MSERTVAQTPTTTAPGLALGQRLMRGVWDLASLVAASIPLDAGYWCADRVADLVYHCAPGYRGNTYANLRPVLGPQATYASLRATARRAFRHSARDFYDLVRLRSMSPAAIERSVTIIGSWEPFERALARGTGAIVVSAHLGSFDFALQTIAIRGYPTVAATVPTVGRFFHDGLTYLRASKGLAVIEATRGVSGRFAAALRAGTSVILANDRDFQRNGVPVCFFGRRTTLPVGAVRLARETGAPIVVTICRRHGRRQTMTIEEPLWLPRTADPDADLRRGMQELVAALERHIRASPEQWVMFQRVWPNDE